MRTLFAQGQVCRTYTQCIPQSQYPNQESRLLTQPSVTGKTDTLGGSNTFDDNTIVPDYGTSAAHVEYEQIVVSRLSVEGQFLVPWKAGIAGGGNVGEYSLVVIYSQRTTD